MPSKQVVDDVKLDEFKQLISKPDANENAIQRFLEANTTFMPTLDVLHHDLHMNCVIAKFPVGERSTDYAYLSKTSVEWRLTLVELEDSSKRIFKPSSKNVAFTAAFTDAVAQIDVWRDYVDENLDNVRKKLQPLLMHKGMSGNRLSVRYMLIIGRSDELEVNEARRRRLSKFEEEKKLRIITYDTVLRHATSVQAHSKAVLRANSRGYFLQSVEGMPTSIFAYVMPEHLDISDAAETSLRKAGYDIDAWKRNEPLTFNEKWTFNSDPALYDGMHESVKKFVNGMKER